MQQFSYQEYVADEDFMRGYREYQEKYRHSARESDKVLIEMVREAGGRSVLDIGCSTGNFLLHLKNGIPGLALTGGDLVPAILEEARQRPELAGIGFEEMDIFKLAAREAYDVVVANAVVHMFTHDQLAVAYRSIHDVLRPGGWYMAFDLLHEFEQDLAIMETSKTHPSGLLLHYRPMSIARRLLEEQGFTDVEFRPFEIPIDLPRHPDNAELISYTVPTREGGRLNFRGILCQPWCHMRARWA
ncbi:MAG: methyltransferase domain-containing protein [Armatimonadetes bacterium]|nr:methyltransferase domain-containing protein [Armatimonadota bacterium]